MNRRRWYGIMIVTLVVATCAVTWFAYVPQHWLRRVSFAAVKVDNHPVPAEVYFGSPTYSEAETIALIHVPGVGDYFFDFGSEMYREASNREFIRLGPGVVTLKPMNEGHFGVPLSSQNLNELRIPSSSGHIVTVQF